MTTIDIRTFKSGEIDEIVFSETKRSRFSVAYKLDNWDGDGVRIIGSCGHNVVLASEEDVDNLIAALNKAKELRWVK